jgi:O-antigen ligase
MSNILRTDNLKNKLSEYFELVVVLSVSIYAGTIFLTDRRATVFDSIVVVTLLAWRFVFKGNPQRSLPKSLIICTLLYLASCFVGALMANDLHWELVEFKRRYIHIVIAWLLFTSPLLDKNRKMIITFYFIAGAIGGVVGILQYYGIMYQQWPRPHGLSAHPILYTALLAFVCCSAMLMFFFKNDIYRSKIERFYLLFIIVTTFWGILVSESRGVWVALVISCIVTLFLYARHDRRKGFLLFCSFLGVCILIITLNSVVKQRAMSIVTSVYSENEEGSTGNRIELWKGSLMLFKRHPLLGVGTGNFQSSLEQLIHEKEVKEMPIRMHAHSIYFHTLATRGIIGFILTMSFFVVLIKYGMKNIHYNYQQVGGYVIFFSCMLTLIGGVTENNIEHAKYLAAFSITISLLGSYGADKIKSTV